MCCSDGSEPADALGGVPAAHRPAIREVTSQPREKDMDLPRNPIQPQIIDGHGTRRFKANAIIRDLLDFATARGMGMNEIAVRDYSASP